MKLTLLVGLVTFVAVFHVALTQKITTRRTVTTTRASSKTPLELQLEKAIQDFNVTEVRRLLQMPGINVNWRNGQNAVTNCFGLKNAGYLHIAICCANRDKTNSEDLLEIVQMLINKGANVNLQEAENGETPLTVATQDDFTSTVVKTLIDEGADVDVVTKDGKTALYRAATRAILETVKLLVEHGADPNLGDFSILTSGFRVWGGYDYYDMLEGFILLMDNGIDVNRVDDEGNTPLTIAANFDADYLLKDIVEPLVNHGANVNHANNDGKTPLSIAIEKDKLDMARFFISHGASTDGCTAPVCQETASGSGDAIVDDTGSGAEVDTGSSPGDDSGSGSDTGSGDDSE